MTRLSQNKAGDIIKLLKKDALAAEAEFNALPVEAQAEVFLDADDSSRIRIVEIAHDPKGLIGLVPAAELWVTVRRMTPHDALPLVKYSSPEQLQVICDIEWWRKDRIEIGAVYEWLEYIAGCGIEKIVEWFRECDWDQILWFFKSAVCSFKKEDKDADVMESYPWPRDEMPVTHDGVYYFQAMDEKHEDVIRRFLEILAKHDRNLYWKLLENCAWDIPSQREEAAYEARSRRLAEHGFPSFDEAIAVYSPLDKRRFFATPKKEAGVKRMIAPRYPLIALGEKTPFLAGALREISPEAEGDFLFEAAAIANKILVADGGDISDKEMNDALRKVFDRVNAGLELLSGGDIQKGAALLSEHWLIHIFQAGLG